MLASITIFNFALVDQVHLEFAPGFNVLTGETGAGKSILIDAITAALGARAGADLVRDGADRASVEAVFDVSQESLPVSEEWRENWLEDGQVILGREITAAGRSTFRINGRLATASAVREVAAELLDIHGQHEHQSLLHPHRHVQFLDAWAGLSESRQALDDDILWLRQTRRRLGEMTREQREREQRLDLIRFQIQEIDAAGISEAEEQELQSERRRLANAERLLAAAGAAREWLTSADHAALDRVASARREVEGIASLDPDREDLLEYLETAAAAIEAADSSLRDYLEELEFNPERLEQIQERLECYRTLKRKYGDSVSEIATFRAAIEADLTHIEDGEEARSDLEAELAEREVAAQASAEALHRSRLGAAAEFQELVGRHLRDLNMAGTRFEVRLEAPGQGDKLEGSGTAEFLLSANPGEPVRSLSRIASGGELSRVMLALKTTMAGSHPVALIFDEIDTGVGGRTAETLGAKMAELSASNQVLCVTHLPQIAAMAGRHIHVSKQVTGGRTQVSAEVLGTGQRVEELARMLGGSEATAAQHARELLASRSN